MCDIFVWFRNGDFGFRMNLQVFPCNFFLNCLKEVAVNFSLNVWKYSPVKPHSPGLLFLGNFKIINSVLLLAIGLFILSIPLCSVLGGWTFLGICPFLLGSFYWCVVVHGNPYDPLYFRSVDYNFSFFIYNLFWLCPWHAEVPRPGETWATAVTMLSPWQLGHQGTPSFLFFFLNFYLIKFIISYHEA